METWQEKTHNSLLTVLPSRKWSVCRKLKPSNPYQRQLRHKKLSEIKATDLWCSLASRIFKTSEAIVFLYYKCTSPFPPKSSTGSIRCSTPPFIFTTTLWGRLDREMKTGQRSPVSLMAKWGFEPACPQSQSNRLTTVPQQLSCYPDIFCFFT